MIYIFEEIAFALKVLKISLGQSSINEKIFSKIICELNSFDLSLNKDNVQNTTKLISLLKIIENINVTHDQTETQFILKKTDDKWRFFVTLDALDTAAESIKCMIYLYKKFSKILDFEWIRSQYLLLLQNVFQFEYRNPIDNHDNLDKIKCMPKIGFLIVFLLLLNIFLLSYIFLNTQSWFHNYLVYRNPFFILFKIINSLYRTK